MAHRRACDAVTEVREFNNECGIWRYVYGKITGPRFVESNEARRLAAQAQGRVEQWRFGSRYHGGAFAQGPLEPGRAIGGHSFLARTARSRQDRWLGSPTTSRRS